MPWSGQQISTFSIDGVCAIPVGREGTPEETTGAVLFLASPWTNYLVGGIVEVDGRQLIS